MYLGGNGMKLIRIIILLLYIPGVADARGDDPLDVIRGTTEQIMVRFTEEPEIAADPGQLRMLVNESIVPNVDFTLLSRLTLGKHWRRASTAQRQRFTDEYRRLLIRTYSNSLTNYNGQAIEHRLLTTTAEGKSATVRTLVQQPGGSPLTVDYSVFNTPAGWKIYDVTIEGISLAITHRSSFGREISSRGMDGFIEHLAARNQ